MLDVAGPSWALDISSCGGRFLLDVGILLRVLGILGGQFP